MKSEDEKDNSWDQGIPKTDIKLQPMGPKALLRVVDILKQQGVSTLKMKFGFPNNHQKNIFQKMLKAQQEDQYFREKGKKKIDDSPQMKRFKSKGQIKKGFLLIINSALRSQIFMNAFKDKLDQLQKECDVKISPASGNIYIQSQKKIGKGSIISSQMLDMYKKLKIYIYYNQPKLWQTVINSQEFKKGLKKLGIYSYAKISHNKHVAFYSLDFKPEEIKRQVEKHHIYQPRVLKLYDNELSFKDNLRIFDLLVKSIRSIIDQLKQVYEGNLQVNKNRSCFVLHLKHKAFEEQPVALISKVISHLFFMSFPLRHSRSFINLLKRNSNLYPFIIASHYNNVAFCCIDRTKIKDQKDLLFIFSSFLQELNQKSKLVIHLKPNCVLQQNSTIPSQILDLTQQCNVQVQDYQKIKESQKFNIVIKPRLFTSQVKKSKKQVEFSNFLVKLLMLEEKQRPVTQDQLNQSFLNNSILNQDHTDDSNENRKTRTKFKQKHTTNRKNEKEKEVQDESGKYRTKRKQQNLRQRGNRSRNQVKKLQNKFENGQNQQASVNWKNLSQNDQQDRQNQQNSNNNILPFLLDKNKHQGCELIYSYIRPEQLQGDQKWKKHKKNQQLQDIVKKHQGIDVKAWKLKVNHDIFGINEQAQNKLIKDKCYLISQIWGKDSSNKQSTQGLLFKKFADLSNQEIGFLVYKSINQDFWVPVAMIQKFQQ